MPSLNFSVLFNKVKFSSETAFYRSYLPHGLAEVLLFFCALQLFCIAVIAHPDIETSEETRTVTVNDAPEQEVYVIGKSVIVNKQAKGVLAIGGDVIVRGRIEGDVATIGGNVIQEKAAYIGGDIIVFGGAYKPESENPLREAGKETVSFGVFEDQLRNFGQDSNSDLFAEPFAELLRTAPYFGTFLVYHFGRFDDRCSWHV